MESHSLNLAHQQYRRAEAHLRYKRFNEAIECHHNAAELLQDAMKSTTSSVALESITLQHSYHLKQKDLIKSKKEQYGRIKKAMNNLKQLSKEPYSNFKESDNFKLQVAIYRTLHETDSLLDRLGNKDSEESVIPIKDLKIEVPTEGDQIDGIVREKNQQTLIEELQSLSQNLHSLVDQLVMQVEVLKDENTILKERVNFLENERVKYFNIQPSDISQQNNFQVVTKSGTDCLPNESHNIPTTHITFPTRVVQQPHFDLSAFKND